MNLKANIKSLLNHYNRYRAEDKKFKNATVRYYNFWALAKSEDCWFSQFIEYRNINPRKKIINFFSVYGSPKISSFKKSPKIFFTGENIFTDYFSSHNRYAKTYLRNYDLALGFNYLEQHNYLRLPLWILYIIPANADFATIQNLIETYNNSNFRFNKDRKNFCANISRHDLNGIRKRIIELLNTIQQVSCAGTFMNNTNNLKDNYQDNKIEYLKTFKFNICPENSNSEGYVTEKLFEAITSGAIPIYWGSNNNPEPSIINPDAVLFYDENNPQQLIDKVNLFWNDDKAYEEFCNIKPFKDNAAEEIWKTLNSLESKIKMIL